MAKENDDQWILLQPFSYLCLFTTYTYPTFSGWPQSEILFNNLGTLNSFSIHSSPLANLIAAPKPELCEPIPLINSPGFHPSDPSGAHHSSQCPRGNELLSALR